MEQRTPNIPSEEKMDRRVRRTRKLLQEGLLELMKQKPLQSISMRELCRAVDVCRTTPYLHYRDVLDILEQIEAARLAELENLLLSYPPQALPQAKAALLQAIFTTVKNNALFYNVILNYEGDPAFLDRMQALGEEYIRQYMALTAPGQPANSYTVPFLLGAFFALLRQYVSHGCPESPAEMAAMTPPMQI